eukprot:GEZU01003412.1.p1 GENE.GEZU01003412.1~~GEZU01003412.1.p1  ORF type:complete len:334 (-),score=68.67 GEZU01003412.1:466-1467(-)
MIILRRRAKGNSYPIFTSTNTTMFKRIASVGGWKRHVLRGTPQFIRKNGKWIPLNQLSDEEILANSTFPMEFPRSYIPLPTAEVPHTRGRKILGELYANYKEWYNKHRARVWFGNKMPQEAQAVWIAPSATVIGDVWLKDYASIWYGAVLRADKNFIEIGGYSNVQDGTVITTDDTTNISGFENSVIIGNYTTIGHGARLHGCRIGDNCIVGMGATVLEGAVVENGAAVAAGAVVPPGMRIPAGELWGGNPIKFMRTVGYKEQGQMSKQAENYHYVARFHDLEFTMMPASYTEVQRLVKHIEERLPEEPEEDELTKAEQEVAEREALYSAQIQ